MSDERRLRVWTWGEEEYTIAYSADDAEAVFRAETGADGPDEEGIAWEPCDDDKVFTYRDEDENGQERKTTKTMREHAEQRGRCYFGSASY